MNSQIKITSQNKQDLTIGHIIRFPLCYTAEVIGTEPLYKGCPWLGDPGEINPHVLQVKITFEESGKVKETWLDRRSLIGGILTNP